MGGELCVEPATLLAVLGMALATYATKAGGLWALGRVDLPERVRAGLRALPGAVLVALVGPELLAAGPAGWLGAAAVVVAMWRTGNLLVALVAGVGVVLAVAVVL